MAINADTLLDRLYLKTQITRWRLLAIAFGVIALLIATDRFSAHSPIEKEFIARVPVEGFIGDDQKFYDLLADVEENQKAKAVIIWIDSPGGSAVGGEEIFLRLRQMAEVKPVVAVMRSMSTSAGYMVALGADHIVAREGTITGSIGVLVETAEISELVKKIGITPISIKSAPLKGSPSLFEKATPESEQVLRNVIMDFYGRFVDMVAERRKLPREEVVRIADGRVYSGKQAFEYKLIDAIGGEREALAWLTEQRKISPELEIKNIKLELHEDWFSGVSESIAGKFFQKSGLGLDGMISIWHPELR
ncbi:MAG: signal peptide peptidase SppA [Rickettsiales bacterium]|jgi:protease-4|nr:signal peptide peptidase SppA [Rickettsiales bacterium]